MGELSIDGHDGARRFQQYSDNGDLIVSTVIKYELRWDSKTPSLKVFDDYILDSFLILLKPKTNYSRV